MGTRNYGKPWTCGKETFIRISKQRAFKLFSEGKHVYFCPCKCHPFMPFSMAIMISGKVWVEHVRTIYGDKYTAEQLPREAFRSALNNWSYYNASYETGYYPHYYITNLEA